jgi:polyisoprenoid-binding protein YceI
MRKRTKVLFGTLLGVVAVLAVAGGAFWYFVLRDDAPPKVSLAGAVNSLTTPTAGASVATAAASGASSSATGINGTWVPDTTQQTFLGYRVNEQLARIGVNTAVGRTKVVTGQVVIDGNVLKSATITGDLTRLASDNNLRDGQLRNQAIETNRFPNATFVESVPITLPDSLASGDQFSTTLNGKLTLHGVTRDVSIAAQAQMKGGLLVVVGSIDILFSDYSISKPNGANVLSIEDHGVMELQLFLKKS